MNHDPQIDPSAGFAIEAAATPFTLRLPPGSAIFAVRGEAWITQERMADDIILGAGQRFDVPTAEPIVISATRGPAALFVARPAAARRCATPDFADFARRCLEQLPRAGSRPAAEALAGAARELAGRARMLVAARPHVPTH